MSALPNNEEFLKLNKCGHRDCIKTREFCRQLRKQLKAAQFQKPTKVTVYSDKHRKIVAGYETQLAEARAIIDELKEIVRLQHMLLENRKTPPAPPLAGG